MTRYPRCASEQFASLAELTTQDHAPPVSFQPVRMLEWK